MTERLEEAEAFVSERVAAPEVAMVLGSGLGAFADTLREAQVVPYVEIPHMPLSEVAGHAGNLVVGTCRGKRVAAMQGRFHLYEGYAVREVVFGVRLMAALGAKTLIVTNAAGGISTSLAPGDLMLIKDQLNLTGTSVVGQSVGTGPRFVDMTEAFDPALRRVAVEVAEGQGVSLAEGVYAGLLGPAYETPAEVRMLRTLGADAVGMSTVLEVIAARQQGMRVLGISCITNLASGMSGAALNHEDVTETAAAAKPRFEGLLDAVIEQL
ncbi:MAG: purine-nucleoside phosphorylase [Myxococcota bacterium]